MQRSSLIKKRAFGLLTRMRDENMKDKLFMIGGLDLQSYDHIREVEVYDSTSASWRFFRNLPEDVLNHYGPETGCIGAREDAVIFVGEIILSLDWASWNVTRVTSVPATSLEAKCTGKFIY